MLQPQYEALKKQIEKVFQKRGDPMDDARLAFAISEGTLHVSVGVHLSDRRVPALRKSLRSALLNAIDPDVTTLDFALTNSTDAWEARMDALKHATFPEREVTLKGDWTLGRIRNWINRNAPDGLDIVAVDLMDIRGQVDESARRSKNSVLVRACLDEPQGRQKVSHDEIIEFIDRFEAEVEIPILLEFVANLKTAREVLKEELQKTMLTKEDIPALKALLAQRLKYRTPAKQPYENMVEGDWLRIDTINALKPEDLLWLEKTEDGVVVHVAIPDITATHNGQLSGKQIIPTEPLKPEKPKGYFQAGTPRLAWITDFCVRDGKIEFSKGPYRGLVDCKKEFTSHSDVESAVPGFEELRKAFGTPTSQGVITKIMELTGDTLGKILTDNEVPYLTRKKPHEKRLLVASKARDIFCAELARYGIKAERSDFISQVKIAHLMRAALEKQAPHSLISALSSAMHGEPVVCLKQPGRCSLKPERGSMEQVNQFILAAFIQNNFAVAPSIVREVLDSPEGIAASLQQFEAERHGAQYVKMLIANLTNQGKRLTVRVRQTTDDSVLCESAELKRLGYIRGVKPFRMGATLHVTLGGFNLDEGRYEFILNPKHEATERYSVGLPDAATVIM